MLAWERKAEIIKRYYTTVVDRYVFILEQGTHRQRLQTIEDCSRIAVWITEPLIRMLDNDSQEVICYARLALIKIGESAIAPLIRASQHAGRINVRINSIKVLGGIGSSQATKTLIAALNDEEALIRQAAAYALMMIKDGESAQALCKASQDTDVHVRRCAVSALGYIANWRIRPGLLQALQDDDDIVKEYASDALRRLEKARAIQRLTSQIRLLQYRRKIQSERMRKLLLTKDEAIRSVDGQNSGGKLLSFRPCNRPNSWVRQHGEPVKELLQYIPGDSDTSTGRQTNATEDVNGEEDNEEEDNEEEDDNDLQIAYNHHENLWFDRVDVMIEKVIERRGDLYLIVEILGEIGDQRARKPLLDLLDCDDDTLRDVVEEALLTLGMSETVIQKRLEKYNPLATLNIIVNDISIKVKQEVPAPAKAIPLPPRNYVIPKPLERPISVTKLCMASVQQKIAETVQVQELLKAQFTEEETASAVVSASVAPAPPAQSTNPFKSLDTAHFVFLNMLLQKPVWKLKDIEAVALPLGLMANGALEHLNDMALEVCDELLFEGDDPVEVNLSLAKELLA
jgi:HEAT repeat protein